jgi:hypothetical protein
VKLHVVEVTIDPTAGAATISPGVEYFEDGKVTRRFRKAVRERVKERRRERESRAVTHDCLRELRR